MASTPLLLACALLLGAEAPAPAGPVGDLPRSSIAAVLAHRGELGLSEAEVSELERRDEALEKQAARIREEFAASSHKPGNSGRGGERSGPSPDGMGKPLAPTAAALPEGSGAGGRGGKHHNGAGGSRSSSGSQDPAARAAAMQSRLDEADTAAWLAAETVLAESRREKARDVAEKYREAVADRRDTERARKDR